MLLETVPGTVSDRSFEWRGRGSLTYVQANRSLCTEQDILDGVFLNLPEHGMHLPFKPVFVSSGVTVGIMNDPAWEELQALLGRLKPERRSSWRRIVRRDGWIDVTDVPHPDEGRLSQIS
ncbi:MAG TPA: hypothetical protein VFE33_25580 [Thermoanaerobaculia bacterium]|nr:hypothetical protein [Thermoanaerobaculia bacterium]